MAWNSVASILSPECSSSNLTAADGGVFDYSSLHPCLFRNNPFLSLPILALLLLLQFYILVKTARDHFSAVVDDLSARLNLSPSLGAVTLLSLGNGAPDVFSSVAAVNSGRLRTGFDAILSAGTFVSAFVVGSVAICAAPFAVDAGSFVRDVMFYLTAAMLVFCVYLSAEIYLWQAVGLVCYYAFFVGIVFFMDFSGCNAVEKNEAAAAMAAAAVDLRIGEESTPSSSRPWKFLSKVSRAWEAPVSMAMKLTIPETSPSKWNRFYRSANVALCPLLLLFSLRSFVPLNHPITFLLPNTPLPLWSVAVSATSSLALLRYALENRPPPFKPSSRLPSLAAAFVMSALWISTAAGELLGCLSALGGVLDLPPAVLGLTVLPWGNSLGDLAAEVAVARAGRPAMAVAGCFAGPMFNMAVGLGTGLALRTAGSFPAACAVEFHASTAAAFVFLVASLMGSLVVVTWCGFRVPRFWGFCLVGIYVVFVAVALLVARFSP